MSLPILSKCCNNTTRRLLLLSHTLRSPRFYSTTAPPHKSIKQNFKSGASFLISSSLIIGGVGLSSLVLYLIGSELFASNGDTTIFNRAVSISQDDPIVRTLLNSTQNEKLKAYGELVTNDKWTRNRPIISQRVRDSNGNLHCKLRFHLQSKERIGLVHAEAIQYKISNDYWYSKLKYNKPIFTMMYIDVKGQGRHFIIKPKLQPTSNNNPTAKSLPLFSWLGLSK
ncbi:mitochondrial import inner membrane translocase subunit Tim21p [Monosporozyma unispora]|nr:mitochondrial import inner membrane translocase subunit tim21 [Kazachstania unispora]